MPFSQDGTLNVAVAHVTQDDRLWALGLETGEIYLRSLPDGSHLRTITGYRSRVEDLDSSPDGRWLAAAAWEDPVRLWDLRGGYGWKTVRSRFTHNVSVCFSPDGSRLVVGGFDGGDSEPHLMIWDLATERELLTLPGAAFGARFSPDGSTLVAEGRGQSWETLLWRAPSWDEIRAREDARRLP